MLTHITELRYWKSEHDEATCEDAACSDSEHGIFAIADGAGTTLFSNFWAKVLVDHFIDVPLLSSEPFEVEWWVRLAQDLAKQQIPRLQTASWNAAQKYQSEGSASTLATLRISRIEPGELQAQLLVVGDSCVLIKRADSQDVSSFPVNRAEDFEKAPICIPSKISLFNRHFHQGMVETITLKSGDTVILATDAVARWIISAGGGLYRRPEQAFDAVAAQIPRTWPAFIKACRTRGEMVDDDSTAVLLSFHTDALPGYIQFGTTTEHRHEIREARALDFQRALLDQNRELAAVYYGDGVDLAQEGIQVPEQEIQQARRVADALRETLAALRQSLNSPDVIARLGPVWEKHSALLNNESCASNLRQTLVQLGIISPPAPPVPPASPGDHAPPGQAEPSLSAPPPEKEWRKIELAREFLGALRADDDEAILSAQEAIQESPYTQALIFTPQEMERIMLAQQRVGKLSDIRSALQSKSIEHMAQAYVALPQERALLTSAELEQLELAYRFKVALDSRNDADVVNAYEHILRSPYFSEFQFTAHEEEQITLAWRQVTALSQINTISLDIATARTLNTSWFNKVRDVKYYYLRFKGEKIPSPDQVERQVLMDIVNDLYIQKELYSIRYNASEGAIDVELALAMELEQFKIWLNMPVAGFLKTFDLTEGELKSILRMFLSASALNNSLQRRGISLERWLASRRNEAPPPHFPGHTPQWQPSLEKG